MMLVLDPRYADSVIIDSSYASTLGTNKRSSCTTLERQVQCFVELGFISTVVRGRT